MMAMGSTAAKRITFQVADAHKPLLSISKCADMGFFCHLGKDGGYLEDTVTGETIPLQRRDNLYILRAWVRRDLDGGAVPNSSPPFVRPASYAEKLRVLNLQDPETALSEARDCIWIEASMGRS